MAMPRTRSGRTTSLRDLDSRLSESERVESAGSWDAIEWTKVDPVSRSVPQGVQQFLLEAEQVIVEVEVELGAFLCVICVVYFLVMTKMIGNWDATSYNIICFSCPFCLKGLSPVPQAPQALSLVRFSPFIALGICCGMEYELGYGVVLVNTDEAGTLFVTNFRLLFLSMELGAL
ncbi:hypothetical protein OROGR_025605 [Orobanche gracilis]